jgi:endonuclease-3 related protein
MVGAVLTQRTNWRNVVKAVAALKAADMMSPRALADAVVDRVEVLVRPAGYYRQKAVRLKRLAAWLLEHGGGDVGALARVPTDRLRQELLSLSGIGPETADSILLYALGRLTFVVDTYTKRVVVRHGLLDSTCTYDELKDLFEANLPADLDLYGDFHAQLVEVGKRYCRPRPVCGPCPVHPLLGDPLRDE